MADCHPWVTELKKMYASRIYNSQLLPEDTTDLEMQLNAVGKGEIVQLVTKDAYKDEEGAVICPFVSWYGQHRTIAHGIISRNPKIVERYPADTMTTTHGLHAIFYDRSNCYQGFVFQLSLLIKCVQVIHTLPNAIARLTTDSNVNDNHVYVSRSYFPKIVHF